MELIRYDQPLAVCIPPYLPPENLPGLAQTIEGLGLRDLWAAEDYFELGRPSPAPGSFSVLPGSFAVASASSPR